MLKSREGLDKLLGFFRSYFQSGGQHIQLNVVDRETLLDAKKHPELYKELLVRVAGYSARFVDLEPDVQDEIISRTEQSI